jgi:hypothetical protein
MNGRPQVFISYSSHDRHHAERLVAALMMNAVNVWYDQRDINVGQSIHERIHSGVIDVDYLGVILTANSLTSSWVREELSLAKQRELEDRQVVILPLLFERVTLPLHLRARKYADFMDFDAGFRDLMRLFSRDALVKSLDEPLLNRIRETLLGIGLDVAKDVQEVRSQNTARLVRRTAMPLTNVEDQLRISSGIEEISPATVFVDIQSAQIEIPLVVDLTERCGSVLARLLQAISLDGMVLQHQRFSFFLVYENIPLELDETLADVGVKEGAHLQLGAYTFLIE